VTEDEHLRRKVQEFAQDITTTVQAVLGDSDIALRATILDDLVIVTTDGSGISLACNGRSVLTLKVRYQCGWDSSGTFLAVERSEFHVFAANDGEPLFRIEFDRDANHSVPAAHLHVHAHRDSMTWAMSRSGDRTPRARRRGRGGVPKIQELHFPLGGKRFRPSLEDVMQMLVEEFGVTAVDGWRQELACGRSTWRRTQARAAARDAPEDAAAVLRELGYRVASPANPPRDGSALAQY
jgi:hypothetical protein